MKISDAYMEKLRRQGLVSPEGSPTPFVHTRRKQQIGTKEQGRSASIHILSREKQPPEKGQGRKVLSEEDRVKLKDAVDRLQKLLGHKIEIDIDKETESLIVKIKDGTTGKIIRQIPPEEFLKMVKRLKEMEGVLFKREG